MSSFNFQPLIEFLLLLFRPLIEAACSEAVGKLKDEILRAEPDKILLTRREAAERLGVSESTLDRWRRKGLPCIQIDDGKPMFRPSSLDQWAAEQEGVAE